MNPLRDSSDGVPLHLNRQLDALCDEYESQLADGAPPPLSDYLPRIPVGGRRRLLEELVNMAAETLNRQGADPVSELMRANPELADELQEILGATAKSNDGDATALYEPVAPREQLLTPRRKRSRGLHIRCPHCSNHVELIGDTPSDEIDCTICGSSFSLTDRSKETRMAEALQQIDRFELVSRLGVGGFGTVWKARDVELDRAVAVKIPRHGQLTDDEMEQFFREARSVAQLRHPNIVPVHEVGREGDAVFIVSDLIRGVSLADMLTGKQFSPREAAELTVTVTDSLEHAHKRGVIHRDLKPSNIMIDDDDKPHLMDFGLAKREAEEVTMTAEGQIVGTPAYMSPEQADGKSAWADRRTDIYSIGVVLFELLTGELPFRGNAQMQVRSRLNEDAPNARTLNRHLPLDLATICAKCLEREPGRRYQTAQEVGDELKRFLQKEPINARPLSPIGRVARWAERKPLHAAVAGLTAFLAIAGPAAAVVIHRQRSQLERKYTENASLIVERERESRDAMERADKLKTRLDALEGRIDPSVIWPPDPASSPMRQQMASLLRARGRGLESPAQGGGLGTAHRLLALATLSEGADRLDEARDHLRGAVDALSGLAEDRSSGLGVSLALADAYDRLAVLTHEADRDESLEWRERGVKLRKSLSERQAGDAELLALWFDSELRANVAAGFDRATERLAIAQELNSKLEVMWPTAPAEIYRIACRLSGRTDWLNRSANEFAPGEATDPSP